MKTIHASRFVLVLAAAAILACATDTAGDVTPPPPPAAPPPAPPPASLVLDVAPASRRATAEPDTPAPADNAAISLTGDRADSTAWVASRRQPWTTLTAASGVGSGVVTWTRNTAGLPPGTYVDTIEITVAGATGSPARVIDTLQVTSAPVPLALQLSPAARKVSAVQGSPAAGSSGAVTLSGDGAASATWTAARHKAWVTLTTASGTGSGSVSWSHNTASLVPGIYVDTIAVTAPGAAGSPASLVDTLQITAPPVPLALALSPLSRSIAVVQGNTAPGDNATVTLTGDRSATTPWTATKQQPWTLLTVASGIGSGSVAWTRDVAALSAGVYVDTIRVSATGATGSPASIVDTVQITPVAGVTPDLGLNADLHGKAIFPSTSLWNQPVDTAQVDPNSAAILGAIGLTVALHPDFGASYAGGPFGIPYIVVPDGQARVTVPFTYASESDAGPYPIPGNPPIEPGGGDNHLLMITQNEWKLYELYGLAAVGSGWHAGSGAIWDLTHGTTRPAGWTSADAAGLPILPGLVRYDEVYLRGEIDHALRFTVQHTRKAYVAPASHIASSSNNPLYAPMGMRVRLKASFDISGYPAPVQVILKALKKYGMMVADNGSNFYLSGTADARWNDSVNNLLKQVKVGSFEVVRMDHVVTQ